MTWLSNNLAWVLDLLGAHLVLTVPAVLLSVVIAVPLGWLGFRFPLVGRPLTIAAGLLYAIPALPLLIVIPALFGTPLRSGATMVIALTLYGVALLVRTAADAFAAIGDDARGAATAIGFSPWQRFWRVELPLAIPVLLSGTRVVLVSTVGLVTIGALIGVSSLGTLLTDGFQRGIIAEVSVGLVATVVLALVLDALLVLGCRMAMPWYRVQVGARA